MAAPTGAADTAAAPAPPTAAAEPEEKVSSIPQMAVPATDVDTAAPPPPTPDPSHIAVPSGAADSAAPPPAPPVSEPAAKVPHALPPTPPLSDAPAPKKRKLEESGFHMSAYYKIRKTIADLRSRFVQVCEATDFRNSDAAREILKEIKIVMELCKKTRLDLSTAYEPAKPSSKPLDEAVMNEPTETIPGVESNQLPETGQATISPNNAMDVELPQA